MDDRVPVRSWGNGCAPIDGWQSLGPDERLVANVEVDVERKWVRAWLLFHYTCDSFGGEKNTHLAFSRVVEFVCLFVCVLIPRRVVITQMIQAVRWLFFCLYNVLGASELKA